MRGPAGVRAGAGAAPDDALQVFGLNVMFMVTSILSAIGSILTLLSSFKVNLKRKPAFHLVRRAARTLRFEGRSERD